MKFRSTPSDPDSHKFRRFTIKNTSTSQRKSAFKLLHAPIILTLCALFSSTGVGTSLAYTANPEVSAAHLAADVSQSDIPDVPQSGHSYWWYLKNDTGDSIFGEWSGQEGSRSSAIGFTKSAPMANGREASTQQTYMFFYHSYWMGRICFRGTWRNFDRAEYNGASSFRLVTRQNAQLFVEFSDNDSYKTIHLGDTQDPC